MKEIRNLVLLNPFPAQKRILQNIALEIVWVGGRRSGKTLACIAEILGAGVLPGCLTQPNSNFVYGFPYQNQAKKVVWDMLFKEFITTPKKQTNINFLIKKISIKETTIEFVNGSKLYIMGLDNPTTIRGMKLSGLIIDEYADIKTDFYEQILRPTLIPTRPGEKRGWCIKTGTTRGVHNQLYRDWERNEFLMKEAEKKGDNSPPMYANFRQTIYDNLFIEREEIEIIKESTSNKNLFLQEYMAEFVTDTGVILRDFDRSRHLLTRTEVENMKTQRGGVVDTIAGIDFGDIVPSAVVVISVLSDGTMIVDDDEWYYTERKIADMADFIKTHFGNKLSATYPDPANASSIEILKAKGIKTKKVVKGTGSIETGVGVMNDLFSSNKLFINRECTNLIKEIETWSHKDESRRKKDFDPVDGDDHAIDALRYAIFTYMIEKNIYRGNTLKENSKRREIHLTRNFLDSGRY